MELPAHLLVGQSEELARGLGTGLAQRLEQPFRFRSRGSASVSGHTEEAEASGAAARRDIPGA
jgi:hypothetical protein